MCLYCVCVCVCVAGGGEQGARCVCGGEAGVTYYIWHSTEVRANGPFFSAVKYMISPPFFNIKYMTDPNFLDWYMKGPTFLVYAQNFRLDIFRGCLFS